MIKTLSKILFNILAILVLSSSIFSFGFAYAEDVANKNQVKSDAIFIEDYGGLIDTEKLQTMVSNDNADEALATYLNLLVDIAFGLGSIAAVALIVWGGIELISGQEKYTDLISAKSKLGRGVLAIVILALSFIVFDKINPESLTTRFDLSADQIDITGKLLINGKLSREDRFDYLVRCYNKHSLSAPECKDDHWELKYVNRPNNDGGSKECDTSFRKKLNSRSQYKVMFPRGVDTKKDYCVYRDTWSLMPDAGWYYLYKEAPIRYIQVTDDDEGCSICNQIHGVLEKSFKGDGFNRDIQKGCDRESEEGFFSWMWSSMWNSDDEDEDKNNKPKPCKMSYYSFDVIPAQKISKESSVSIKDFSQLAQ